MDCAFYQTLPVGWGCRLHQSDGTKPTSASGTALGLDQIRKEKKGAGVGGKMQVQVISSGNPFTVGSASPVCEESGPAACCISPFQMEASEGDSGTLQCK